MHAVPVLPLGGAARAEIAVARGGQRLPQPLLLGNEAVIREREVVHRDPPTWSPWRSSCEGAEESFDLVDRGEDEVGCGRATGDLRIVGVADEHSDARSLE